MLAEGYFDPPTSPCDADGQGVPYATYAFGAQMAEVEVDLELGTTRVLRIVAAHDVGRALNPQQVEGQIHGGLAEGIGIALMEVITRIAQRGFTVFMIEHDMRFVMGLCEQIAVLNFGRIIAQGGPQQIRNDPQVIEAYLGRDDDDAGPAAGQGERA